jgi:CPA1 family monovalent cation:H+ antiporter
MSSFEVVLVLLVVVAGLEPIASKTGLPPSVVLVLGGIGVSFVPAIGSFEFDPDIAFMMFVPPMLYSAAFTTSMRDLRRNVRPIVLLAVGLVLATAAIVAIVAHELLPAIGWGAAFVLGAIVAPPDAAVAISIARSLGIPRRLVTLLEGESLMNDVSAFVAYQMAIGAAMTGAFSWSEGAMHFVWAAVAGVIAGLVTAAVATFLRRLVNHASVEVTVSLLTPFAAFLPAEFVGGSGVLAVVVAGLALGRVGPRITSARARIQMQGVWATLNFLLEGLVFLLIGLEIGEVVREQMHHFEAGVLIDALIISGTVIAARVLWMFPAAYGPRIVPKIRSKERAPSWRAVLFTAWTGPRGGDTLVTALAIPLVTSAGTPFPAREEIVTISFVVIVVTLLFQGLTLQPLARLLGLKDDDTELKREEARARRRIADEGLATMRTAAQEDALDAGWTEKMVGYHELRTQREATNARCATDESPMSVAFEKVQRRVLETEREVVITLRDEGAIDDATARTIQREIDFEELRISEDEDFE